MRILLFFLIFSLSCTATFAQAPGYYYFNTSQTAVKTIYNDNGKVIGKQECRQKQGTNTSARGENRIEKEGKEPEVTECSYSIDGSRLLISMGKNSAGREVFLDYCTGMNLRGVIVTTAAFETTARLAGREIEVSCKISNRKALQKTEMHSSAAGKWECIRTEYDMELRGKIFGIGIPVNVHVVEWFAPGTGIIRTEIYRRGKLQETRLLTQLQ